MKQLWIFLILLSSCGSVKPTLNYGYGTDGIRSKKLDEYFSKLTALEQFNGVVLAFNTEKIYHKAFNLGKKKTASTFVTPDSRFDIHSISKLVAKAIILELETEGKITRDMKVRDFIPDFPRGDEITIQHLMDNASGLPREPSLEGVSKRELDPDQIIEWAKKENLAFDPGSDKTYSNVGYEILYYIIGEVTKSSFAEYVNNVYFPKLGMEQSGSRILANSMVENEIAKNHVYDDKIEQVDNVTEEDFRHSMLYANASDLQKFLGYVKSQSFSSDLENSKGIIGWSGGGDGIRTHARYNPDNDYSFVILANFDEIPLQQILTDVAKIMEDKPVEMPKAIERKEVKVSEETLKKYVGKYRFKEANNIVLELRLKKGVLEVYQDGKKLAPLIAESETVYYFDPTSNDSFEFFDSEEKDYDVLMGWKGVKLQGTKQ